MKTSTLIGPAALCVLVATGFALLRGGSDPAPSTTASRPERAGLGATATNARGRTPVAQVEVVGLMVQRTLRAKPEFGEALPFMGTFAHTRLALEVSRGSGGIVDLQRDACKLTAFADDRGTSLLPTELHDNPFEMMPAVAADGTSLAFVLASKKSPDGGASSIDVTGEIALLVASKKATETSAAVTLEPGAQLEVGPFTFEVEGAAASEWSDGWALTLQTKSDTASILHWTLVDESEVETELRPTSSWNGMGTWSQTLECDVAVEDAALRLEYWFDAHVERVPFDVSAAVGLR